MHLAGETQAALEEWARGRGARPGSARVLARGLLLEFSGRPVEAPPAAVLLAQARAEFQTQLPRAEAVADPEGTVRFAVKLDDGVIVETVAIHQPATALRARERWTLCVSSQAGCARGCVFCETGRLGLVRNLSAAEIVSQYAIAARHLGQRPRNVVFMGMGEPLDNLEEVLRAIEVLREPAGFAVPERRITVSTVGIVPKLDELYARTRAQVAVSLHAVDPQARLALLPVARKWPLEELRRAIARAPRTVLLQWTLIAGVNDGDADADGLARFAQGLDVRVNLIPLNPGPVPGQRAPPLDRCRAFQKRLADQGVRTLLRMPHGQEIGGACGQLAGARSSGSAHLRRPRLTGRSQWPRLRAMKRWQKILAIAVAVVIAAVFALSLVLDSILTSKAHEQAQKLSQEWGRPVQIGSVATKLLTGLGVRVSEVQIGAAQGEDLPLVNLKGVEVKLALLKAAFSGGKDVEIHSAEIQGLTVNIERFADGTTNLQHLQEKLAGQPAKKEEQPAKQTDLSFLRVDHLALVDGKITFVDKSNKSPNDLAIQHLDLTVNDLRAGKPLEIVLKAAVLTDKQNLELRVKAAPLPVTLTPTPVSVVLRIDPPIDLGPLGPFAGKELGLKGGTFDADFDAELGAAVPGGSGPTTVKGTVKLAALDLKDAGKKLDVTLDTDVRGDAEKGDLQIDKLKLDIGPAGLSGQGRASGLKTPSPRIEGLEIVSHDLDLSSLAAYYPPLKKMLAPNVVAGPIGLRLSGTGSQAAQALELKVDLTPVHLVVPGQLAKAAGAAMTITAQVKGAAASGGPIRFDAHFDLGGVDLRPGKSVDKAPGQRLDLALDGTRSANKSSTDPEQKIELANLKMHILDDELQGTGWVEMKGTGAKKTTQFELQLLSSGLNLDKMLIPSTTGEKEEKPLDPKAFAGLSGHASVKIDKLTMKKQTVTDLVADVSMKEDEIKVNTAQLKAFGGSVSAGGTELKLAHPKEPFHVVTKLDNVGIENLIALGTEHKLLAGKFNGTIDLKGGGQELKDLSRTLAGVLDGHLLDGVFYGKDLIASVSGPLSKALPFGLAGKEGQGGTTSLGKDLPFGVTIENGVARLKQPIKITTAQGDLSFSGGMRVDGQLDLPGTVSLAPSTIAAITGGKVKPAQPIPVNLKLTGPAWSPTVTDLDLKPAVSQIVKEGGAALLGKALGVDTSQAQEAAQKKAADEANKEKQKLQDEAAKKLRGLFGK